MGGIRQIQQLRDVEKESRQSAQIRDLYLRDGDQALIALVPSGTEEDNRLDSIAFHSVKETFDSGKQFWKTYACPAAISEDAECRLCAAGGKRGLQFVMWVYVYSILHTTEREGWVPDKTASGTIRYREDVNDFRILMKGFGRNDYLWNQVTDIFNEHGSLNKFVVRFRRTGSGMIDTAYNFVLTTKQVLFDDATKKQALALPAIVTYVAEHFALPVETTNNVVDFRTDLNVQTPTEELDEDLF